ncbi:MAG TPA: hypothetical protein VG102_03280 [Candidatus Paceibacterota bacterium]|jgi:hypothetical protein|nr:hypothetical protein [Candidatus Paceibacterota bacterium]
MSYTGYFRFVTVTLIVVALGGLLGWYYFLQAKNAQTNAQNTGAGYSALPPSFEGSTGSTYANIVSTLGESPGGAASSTSRLWEVSEVPVAGFGWQKGAEPTLYFIERSSGYVFEAQVSGHSVTRLTDTLRPKIYDASVTMDGSVVERSVDMSGARITFAGSVASSSAIVAATTSVASLIGNDLPQGIGTIAADPAYDTLFFTIPNPSGVSIVSTNVAGEKERSLFSSSITGWRLLAPGDGTVVLLQNPLDSVIGYAYHLQKSGALVEVAQAPGLTVLPHASSSALIFGSSQNGSLSLFAQSSADASPAQLPIQTVADKCAWAPGAALIAYCGVPETVASKQFLDDWYKGLLHTSDRFFEINISAASTILLYDPSGDTSAQLDVTEMYVDPTGQYLAFISGTDGSLWVLRIAQ